MSVSFVQLRTSKFLAKQSTTKATNTPTTTNFWALPPTSAATIARAGSFGPPRSHLLYKEQLTDLHALAPSGMTGRGKKWNQNQQVRTCIKTKLR